MQFSARGQKLCIHAQDFLLLCFTAYEHQLGAQITLLGIDSVHIIQLIVYVA